MAYNKQLQGNFFGLNPQADNPYQNTAPAPTATTVRNPNPNLLPFAQPEAYAGQVPQSQALNQATPMPIQGGGVYEPGSDIFNTQSTREGASNTFNDLMQSIDYQGGIARNDMLDQLDRRFGRRNIRQSGIHRREGERGMRDIAGAQTAARQAASLGVYGALQRDQAMRMEWDKFMKQLFEQQTANKNASSPMAGLGNLVGTIAGSQFG